MAPRTPRVCAAIAIAALGCSYDWSIPATPPDDAGAPFDATVPVDASPPSDVDASDAAPAPTDAGVDSADPCAALIAAADSAYARARTCATLGSSCTTAPDQCACAKPVAADTSSATHDYAAAVAAIVDAGCASGCVACGTPPATSCLDMPVGDGAVTMTCQ